MDFIDFRAWRSTTLGIWLTRLSCHAEKASQDNRMGQLQLFYGFQGLEVHSMRVVVCLAISALSKLARTSA